MEKEFIPRELAIRLKDIGYDEEVFAWTDIYTEHIVHMYATNKSNMNKYKEVISIPTWQSAFRWFREKYGLFPHIFSNEIGTFVWCIRWYVDNVQKDIPYKASLTYEEAELACLEKLIEIVEQ